MLTEHDRAAVVYYIILAIQFIGTWGLDGRFGDNICMAGLKDRDWDGAEYFMLEQIRTNGKEFMTTKAIHAR